MKRKITSHKTKLNRFYLDPKFIGVICLFLAGLGVSFIGGKLSVEYNPEVKTLKIESNLELSERQVAAYLYDDKGSVIEDNTIPTVEAVNGGRFEEEKSDGDYEDLGAIESVKTASVEEFKTSVLNRCIYANNKFGAQCVSLARAFWWDYAGFDVTTCGTGLAKGMMDCSSENAKDKFQVIWNTDEIIKGTWIVTDGSYTGHICMALGPVINGYVTCLGENQGGKPCEKGGSAANIINLSVKNFIGGYIPNSYIPVPEPEPILPPDTGVGE